MTRTGGRSFNQNYLASTQTWPAVAVDNLVPSGIVADDAARTAARRRVARAVATAMSSHASPIGFAVAVAMRDGGYAGALVDGGWLERRPYQHHPVRYDYLLTGDGRDLAPIPAQRNGGTASHR